MYFDKEKRVSFCHFVGLEQLQNTPQHLTTIVSPRWHSLKNKVEYNSN